MRISDWSSDVCSSDLQSVPPFVWLANPYQNNGVTLLQYRTTDPADAPFSSDPYNQNIPTGGGAGSSGGPLTDSMDPDFTLPTVWQASLGHDADHAPHGLIGSVRFQRLRFRAAPFYRATH